ncbi:hypothetical protein BpHYR1_046425 [Brachionus plicatilis]|uniref:Uncharacterized protein n=1 Tax=Brachionus plicatilis TaxID=10195 RepID=A0A3M7PP23_BRAPC|nr:hypothetical protein BpHYR1_046425 [Brachionus plicatilis]
MTHRIVGNPRLRYSSNANGKLFYWGIRWGELRKIPFQIPEGESGEIIIASFDLDESAGQNSHEATKKSDSAVSIRSGTTVVSVKKALTDLTDYSRPGATKAKVNMTMTDSAVSSPPGATKAEAFNVLKNSTDYSRSGATITALNKTTTDLVFSSRPGTTKASVNKNLTNSAEIQPMFDQNDILEPKTNWEYDYNVAVAGFNTNLTFDDLSSLNKTKLFFIREEALYLTKIFIRLESENGKNSNDDEEYENLLFKLEEI